MAKSKSEFEEFGEGDDAGGGESAGVDMEAGGGMLVDLSGTSENVEYKTLPRGIYDAELVELEYGQSQRSGNNMWTTVWELTDEHQDLFDEKGKPPRLWVHLTFNDGGLPRVKRFLARIKTEDDINKKLLTSKFDPEKVADEGVLIGARARLKTNLRRYEGSMRTNVQEILPPSGGAGGDTSFASI